MTGNFPLSDLAILLVSGSACVYCVILSRRLRSLNDTKAGLGATISAMNQSIAAMSRSTEGSREAALSAAARLETLIGEARVLIQRLESLSGEAGQSRALILGDLNRRQGEIAEFLQDMIDESKTRVGDMILLVEEMERLTHPDRLRLALQDASSDPHGIFAVRET